MADNPRQSQQTSEPTLKGLESALVRLLRLKNLLTASDVTVTDSGGRWVSFPKDVENVLAEIDDKIIPAPGLLTLVAGENLLAGEAIKSSSSNTVLKADASGFNTCDVIGFAKSDTLSGLNVEIYTIGNVVDAQFETGLSPVPTEDEWAYISLTLGALTNVPPAVLPCIHKKVGKILDASMYVGTFPINSKVKILIDLGEALFIHA